MAAKRETYRLTIEAQPHATVPAQVRLRSVLKRLLRTFGFRAVKVECLSEQSRTLGQAEEVRE